MMIVPRPTRRALRLTLPLTAVALSMLLACTTVQTTITSATPAWACPSPTPLPYGETGPVKEVIRHSRPTAAPRGPVSYDEEPVYYAVWEQEYGSLASGPPFPSPTPYVLAGNVFTLGQRVWIDPLYALVDARPGAATADGHQISQVTITWRNTTITPIAIDYAAQVQLLSVRHPNGTETMGDGLFLIT